MSWTPLVERFSSLPLILAGPILRRTEPGTVTVWLALKESQRVTLRIYARNAEGNLIQQLEGTRRTVRLGDHLHIVAVTAHPTNGDESLTWGELYYYDLFFQAEGTPGGHVPATAPHLDTPGVLNIDPSSVDALGRLVYPGHRLDAIDTWRGEESDPRVESFANILGLPAPFNGSGELQRSEQALHWHYTYYGPHYQVIVMDTRTQRLYLSPGEFPGLLSPSAMQTQVIAANHEEAEVTLIISATPVIGVDFVESMQFFSRWRIRDNYSYDRESWALEWGTFQHFLKTVSAMKRVVFLSGDVHYAFGSSLEYWDYHTKATAKLINYTSSPLCNEGAGSHIAVLAVGYPQLLHLLRREGTATLDFLAWDIVAGDHHILKDVLAIIRKRLYEFWWSVPRLIAAQRSPYEIVLPARGWLKGAFNAFPPDRVYRLHYLRNTLYHRGPEHVALQEKKTPQITLSRWLFRLVRLALACVTFVEEQVRKIRSRLLSRARRVEQARGSIPPPAHAVAHGAIKGAALLEHKLEKRRNRLVEALFHREEWLGKWKAGVLIVGYNNIGEIAFHWTLEKKDVIQRLWWWHPDDSEQPLFMTEYSDTLEPPAPETAPSLP